MAATTRQRRRESRRREVLDAAMSLVIDEGMEALTIARLAEQVGAAVGALYRYFPGKSALIAELQALAAGVFDEFQRAELSFPRSGATRVDALVAVLVAFGAYSAFRAIDPARYSLIDASVSDPRQLLTDEEAQLPQAVLQRILVRCGGVLQAAEAVGALAPGDAEERTHVVWASLHGIGHFRKRDGRPIAVVSSDRMELGLLRGLLAGWGAPAADLAAAIDRWAALREERGSR